jgi:hypothetical protein
MACALLWQNARASVRDAAPPAKAPGWRAWDDLAIAIGYAVSGEYPVAPYRITNRFRRDQEDFLAFRARLLEHAAAASLQPQAYSRTLPLELFRGSELYLARRWDDPGRAMLLGLAFRSMDGVAVFLLPWLAVLFALPVLAWVSAELVTAGKAVAGAVFGFLFGCSAFAADLLTIGYSSAGFALIALLLLVAFAAYAVLGRPSWKGLLVRAAIGGCVFGWCAAARSVALLTLPALALTLSVAAARASAGLPAEARPRRRVILAASSLALLLLPYQGVRGLTESWLDATLARREIRRRPVQQHDVWVTLWQGLGDFDRSKGHVFLDQAGELEAKRHGSERRLSEASENLFRELVLQDIRRDPLWFAGILAQRAWATVTLQKLWPRRASDGVAFAPAEHASEGVTDSYYAMTLGADTFRIAGRELEAPAALLLAPLLFLLLLAVARAEYLGAQRAAPSLAALGCVALGVLPAPVLVTTASSFELQCFVVVHLLAAALLAETLSGWLRRPPVSSGERQPKIHSKRLTRLG